MNTPSTVELMLRMVVSLAIMGGLLWVAVRLSRGRRGRALLGAMGTPRVEPIEVKARRQLARGAGVSLVQVGSRTLLLGVGERGVQLLAEGDDLVPLGAGTTAATTNGHNGRALVAVEAPAGAPTNGGNGRAVAVVEARAGAPTNGQNGRERAGTPAPGASGPDSARTGVMDALRELTVRR